MTRTRRAAILILGTIVLSLPASAQQISLGQQQALLLFKILEQDQKLGSVAPGALSIAVLYKAGNARSEAMRGELSTNLQGIVKKKKLLAHPVQIVDLPYANPADLDTQLSSPTKGVAVYVCPGFDPLSLMSISAITRHRSVLSFASDDAYVRMGLGVGLVQQTTEGVLEQTARIALLINLPAVQAEGAELQPELLKLAEVLH